MCRCFKVGIKGVCQGREGWAIAQEHCNCPIPRAKKGRRWRKDID